MKTLDQLLEGIGATTGISPADFVRAVPFGPQSLWGICDYVDRHGERSWTAVDLNSGNVTPDALFVPGRGEWLDALLYFATPDRSSLIMVLPEAGVGVQCVINGEVSPALSGGASTSWAAFKSELDWAKLGERNAPWTTFINEWKDLERRYR